MTRNVQKDSRGDKKGNERRPPVTYERQRDSGKGNDVQIDAHVDERLDEYPGNDSHRDVFRKKVVHPPGDPESPVRDVAIARKKNEDSNESQLFGNDRENEVALDFGKIAEFLNGFSETEPEKPSASYGDEPLFGLKIDSAVGYGRLIIRKKIVDAFGDVGQRVAFAFNGFSKAVHRKGERRKNSDGYEDVFGTSSSHEKHNYRDRSDQKDRAEVRLEGQ